MRNQEKYLFENISKICIDIKKKVKLKNVGLHEPYLSKEDISICSKSISNGYVSTFGKDIAKLESKLKEFLKCKYVILTNSGTSAMHALLISIGIEKNDEVLVPSLTFVGTVNPILYLNAIPNFVDVDLANHSVCPKKLEEYLKKNTFQKNNKCYNKTSKRIIKALIIVHIFGQIGEIDNLKKVSKKYNLKLIEDGAESLGSTYQNKHAGNFGDAGIVSFNGNKIITTGAGGAILTNNKSIAVKASHITSTSKVKFPYIFYHDQIGYNYRIANINASLGISQLNKINFFLKSKKELHKKYDELFINIDGVKIMKADKRVSCNYWLNCLILNKPNHKLINKINLYLNKKGFGVRPFWNPIHTLKFCKDFPRDDLSNTMHLFHSCLCLPSSAFLNEKL